jgi:hypothetical protein
MTNLFKPTDVLEFTCPECVSHSFGTSNCSGEHAQMVGHCHGIRKPDGPGYAPRSCNFSWSRADDVKYFKVVGQRNATEMGVLLAADTRPTREACLEVTLVAALEMLRALHPKLQELMVVAPRLAPYIEKVEQVLVLGEQALALPKNVDDGVQEGKPT